MTKRVLWAAILSILFVLPVCAQIDPTYGGYTNIPCTNATGKYQPAKIGKQWMFCTPNNYGFFMQGIFNTAWENATDWNGVNDMTLLQSKYATGTYGAAWNGNWAYATAKRMQTWGFNTVGEYSRYELNPTYVDAGVWNTADHTIPSDARLPYTYIFKPMLGATTNHAGDLSAGQWAHAYCTGLKQSVANMSTLYPTFCEGADPFDPLVYTAANHMITTDTFISNVKNNIHNEYFFGWVTDDSDNMGMSRCGTDFQYMKSGAGTGNPPTGDCAASFGYFTLIHAPYEGAGVASRDSLLNTYAGVLPVYADPQFKAKAELATWLQGSTDRGPGYASIAALNAAWGSSYTTFGSSRTTHTATACATGNGSSGPYTCTLGAGVDPLSLQVFVGGTLYAGDDASGPTASSPTTSGGFIGANVSSGTFNYSTGALSITFTSTVANATPITVNYSTGGWGVGTGLLDEDGNTAHAWMPTDIYFLTRANATMQTDLDNFLYHSAKAYWSGVKTKIEAFVPGYMYLGPTGIGSGCAPARPGVLRAAGEILSVIPLNTIPCLTADDQARYDFVATYGGDKAWIEWKGFTANQDSYLYNINSTNYAGSETPTTTQPARGNTYLKETNLWLNMAGSTDGVRHIAGFRWWAWYDSRAEQLNWGLVTRRDNSYDGSEATTGTHACSPPTAAYSCGSELTNFGNFLASVKTANALWYGATPPPPTGNVTLTPASQLYTTTTVGQSLSASFTLWNQTTANVTISSQSVTGTSFSLDSTHSTCFATLVLSPTAQCTLTVVFAPASATTFTGTLTVANTFNTLNSTLTGTGISAPVTPRPRKGGKGHGLKSKG